jgi:hypothetical protein
MDAIFNLETVKKATFDAVARQAADANRLAVEAFALAADGWKNTALRNRELGIPIPPKPEAPLVIHITADAQGWPTETDGPDRVAAPVPDLDPLPKPPEGIVVLIGVSLGEAWYQSMPGDNAPDGFIAMKDGATYRKVCYPFGGWWLKV